jgi:hypothetical protein
MNLYWEGYLDHEIDRIVDDRFEARGQGRPNETKRLSIH